MGENLKTLPLTPINLQAQTPNRGLSGKAPPPYCPQSPRSLSHYSAFCSSDKPSTFSRTSHMLFPLLQILFPQVFSWLDNCSPFRSQLMGHSFLRPSSHTQSKELPSSPYAHPINLCYFLLALASHRNTHFCLLPISLFISSSHLGI